MRSPAWLLALLPLLTTACATSAAYHPQKDCAAGSAGACADWGAALVKQGEAQQAEAAYGQACEGGISTSCITQGQMMMKRGELEAAEHPLRKAYLEEFPEAYEALADLYQARGDAPSLEIARDLRFQAPAIDKPASEIIFQYRFDLHGGLGTALLLNLQPMAFLSRRLNLGFHAAFGPGAVELNGFIGYQHFVSQWIAPYTRVLVGGLPGAEPGRGFNLGGELGVKLCLGPLGHLDFAVGASRGSPLHVSAGLGLDAILVLLLAAAR